MRPVFLAFVINLFIYGQKIFSGGLAADDIARFFHSGGEQASWLGRWFGGFLNLYVFTGPLHILPYANGLLGVFCYTLAGYLTALLFFTEKRFPAVIVTLLCSATPFVVHNLFFNTNSGVSLGILFGVWGILLAYKSRVIPKVLGFVLLVLSISTYQTIIQVALAIILFRTALTLKDASSSDSNRQAIVEGLKLYAFVALAFIVSNIINLGFTSVAEIATTGRYEDSLTIQSVKTYGTRLVGMFSVHAQLRYFSVPYVWSIKIFALLGFSALFLMLGLHKFRNLFSLKGLFFGSAIILCPIIINLPQLLGQVVQTRAHYTVGWMTAGLFVILYLYQRWFKNLGITLASVLIIICTLYINIFLYAGTRQTDMDIMRANQIVSAIRQHEDYPGEADPLKFSMIGTKELSVLGWRFHDQTAFATDWSNTDIFEAFTDLNFDYLSDAEYVHIEKKLVEIGEPIHPFPARSSFFFHGDTVVVFMDTDDINEHISNDAATHNAPEAK